MAVVEDKVWRLGLDYVSISTGLLTKVVTQSLDFVDL